MKARSKCKKCLFVVFFMLSIFLINFDLNKTSAPSTTYEISSLDDLINASTLSKTEGYQNATFILTKDITITDEEQENLNSQGSLINFGSADYPFSGIFEGNGHSIRNLQYAQTLAPKYDTGLFSYTDGATIRNLVIDHASISSDYRGGIVVGSSNNTRLENVTVNDSHLFVSAVNNVLTLVTDGGIRGGGLIGEANNSVIYNCEVKDTFINTNNTSGVAALGGKGLTLGGLVGISNNTTIEYSRVTGGTRISNYYDVTVGAVGGNVLYVGGIVGQMNGTSKVIDSFSTAELYYYCATYVSVGAGNIGHIGGITAAMNGSTNEIHRSHYAGVATSRQYNAVLVVPIIQNNQNISGIADVYDGGAVVSTYFKPSLNPNVTMKVLGNSNSTTAYGPLDDARFVDKEYFQDQSYDFSGTIRRNTEYNNNHFNKWVMDINRGIPVHGKSISVGFNFPNSGEVNILPSQLVNTGVSTSDAYKFAVQGFLANETSATINATPNANYRFVSWYRVPNTYATQLDGDNEFYENVFANSNPVSTSRQYNVSGFSDNDLYVAKMQAKVVFHDVDGHTINESGNQELLYEKYYDYLEGLPDVKPVSNTTSTFIGWTTIPKNANSGYDGISSVDLNYIKSQNEFYVAGDKITKPLSLYPIYIDVLSNVNLVFEGNELDNISDASRRDGVGNATINKTNNSIVLGINGADNGSLPDGYRFLGWYENDYKISKNPNYTISLDDIDLTVEHTFTARFEYRVKYYIRAFHQDQDHNTFNTETLFDTIWYKYNEQFINIGTPSFIRENITHWGVGGSCVDHGSTDNLSDAFTGVINTPISVYSHNYTTANNGSTGYEMFATTDFPGAGDVSTQDKNTGAYFTFTPVSPRYHLEFWSLENDATLLAAKKTYVNNPMDTGTITSTNVYKIMAFVYTDVIFHYKNGTTISVNRKYNSNVLMSQDKTTNYNYPFYNTSTPVSTSTSDSPSQKIDGNITEIASPTEESMQLSDYYFIGWIADTQIPRDSREWNYIYDVAGDAYVTSDINKALPYIISNDLLVEKTMNLYPVYAKYNIETTTSIANITSNAVNKPLNPTYTLIKNSDGTGVVAIVPDENTYIKTGESEKYDLDYLSVIVDDGEEEILVKDGNGNYIYNVVAGKHYKFIANYIPYILLYHLNTNSTETKILNKNDQIGTQPDPTFNVANNYLFVGWVKEIPGSSYHTFNSYSDFTNSNMTLITSSTLVTDSYELYPVYVKHNITVNSNIDDYLQSNEIDSNSVYSLKRNDIDTMSLIIKTSKLNNYYFAGWYENYVDNSHLGDFISSDITYKLPVGDNYQSKVYTAVFKNVYELRYHNLDGSILDTIYVKEDEQRSFVTSENNNEEVIEIPIDGDVYMDITRSLSENQFFKQFNYIDSNNTITEWEDYKDVIIRKNMDLYPVIYEVDAKDASNNSINLNNQNSILMPVLTKDKFIFKFTGEYLQPKLTIHADEIQYTRNTPITTNLQGKLVELYSSSESNEAMRSASTDTSGNAVFELKNKFTITSINNSTKNSDDILLLKYQNTSTNEIGYIAVPSNETVEIWLYYGNYTLTLDNNWSWRSTTYSENITSSNISINEKSFTVDANSDNWFDKTNYRKNSFEVEP